MKPTKIWRLWLLAPVAALALIAAGCGGGGNEAASSAPPPATTEAAQAQPPPATGATVTVRMGIEPWIGYGPWWIAKEKGFDRQNGVDLQITNFSTDADINSAFAGGKIDVENLATHTGIRFLGAGVPLTFVLFEDVSRTADAILAGPDIKSIADLKGKKVAYEEGTTSDLLLRYALAQNGMSLDDIKVVPIPASDAGAAVIAGKVDVAVTYEPYLTAALKQGQGFHLVYSAGEQPGLISDLLAARPDFVSAHPDAIVGALEAWQQAIDFYRSNTDEAQAIIAKQVGAKPEDLKESFAGVDLYDLKQSKALLAGGFAALAKQIEDILKEQGTLEGNPDVAGAVDGSFEDKALGGGSKY